MLRPCAGLAKCGGLALNISQIESTGALVTLPIVKTLPMLGHRALAALSGLTLCACAVVGTAASAQTGLLFRGADLALGEKLMAEHQCTACHTRRVGGNGSAIYRPQGKVNTAGLLRGMVDYCSTELNMGLFPEEVTAVAAVLDRDHYRFETPKSTKGDPRAEPKARP